MIPLESLSEEISEMERIESGTSVFLTQTNIPTGVSMKKETVWLLMNEENEYLHQSKTWFTRDANFAYLYEKAERIRTKLAFGDKFVPVTRTTITRKDSYD